MKFDVHGRSNVAGLESVVQRLLPFVLALLSTSMVNAQLLVRGGGLVLIEEGPAAAAGDPVPDNMALAAIPFSSSELGPELGIDFHVTDNLNDGFYGNGFSWIGGDENPFPESFAGVDLGGQPQAIQSFAFGRSNVLSGDPCNGVCTDRHQGLYTLQYTQVPHPSRDLDFDTTDNPATGWATIGLLEYGVTDGPGTNFNFPWQRHRYNFDSVDATGIRLVVPFSGLGGGTAIDEIELYSMPGEFVPPPEPAPPIAIVATDGYSVTWDGNNGDFFDDDVPPNGALVPDNVALAANGGLAFTSSDLGPELGIDFHIDENINDGFYGNANSWIGGDDNPFAPVAFAGIAFDQQQSVSRVAWGRDNGNDFSDACGGQCTDRSDGTYLLQVTRVADPNAETEETGDVATGWLTLAELSYGANTEDFQSYLRHEFAVDDGSGGVLASAIRIVVPGTGLAGGTAIDEIEVYVDAASDPCDVNGDGLCDVADIDALTSAVRSGDTNTRFDLNLDGRVDGDDRIHWVTRLRNTWLGDSNLDGEFSSADLVAVFQGGAYDNRQPATWATGDWSGDGIFDSTDFLLAFTDGGFEVGPRGAVAIPEPACFSLTLLLVTPLLRRQS